MYNFDKNKNTELKEVTSNSKNKNILDKNNSHKNYINFMQNTIGNQAVLRLMKDNKNENVNKSSTMNIAPPIVHDVLNSSGQPLEEKTRNIAETYFGHTMSRVRVHNDTKANKSAESVNAQAYTVGQKIVFNKGQYAPKTSDGSKLLFHEL